MGLRCFLYKENKMKFKRLNESSEKDKYNKIVKILKSYNMKDSLKRLELSLDGLDKDIDDEEESYNMALTYGMPWFEEIKDVLES